MQEIYLLAWKRFDHYLRAREDWPDFGAWLFLTGRKAVYRYYALLMEVSTKKPELFNKRRFVNYEVERLCEIADIEYDHTEFYYLQRAIDTLTDHDKNLIARYLDGENFGEMSVSAGKNLHYYSRHIARIKGLLREKLALYIDYKSVAQREPGLSQERIDVLVAAVSKPIIQVDFNGEIVKEWPSAREAARNGFCHHGISDAVNKRRKTYAGYAWFFASTSIDEIKEHLELRLQRKSNKKWKVIKLSQDGQPVKEYSSLRAVEDDGYDRKHVSKAIHEGKTYQTYYWKKTEELVAL
jgi:DNA-directed RNA polymerase specialized sigma24 family protein